MENRTLVLDIGQNRDDVLAGINDAVSAVNRALGTAFASAGVEHRGNVRYTMWSDYSGADEPWLRLADDSGTPSLYLDMAGASPRVLDELTDALKATLKVLSCAQLKRTAREAQKIEAGLLTWLGMACRGPYDAEVADLVEEGFASDDPKLRSNAQLATFLLKWKQLLPAVEDARRSETVAELKRGLDYLADELRNL